MKSFAIYLAGIAALFGIDLMVTTFAQPEEIGSWATVRSLIGITGSMCLVGFDYVLIRSPQSSTRLLRILAVQIPALALVVGLFVWSMDFLSSIWISFAIAAGSATSLSLSQYFRSHHLNVHSQVIRQAWKVVALIVIGFFLFTGRKTHAELVTAILFVCLIIGSSLMVFLHRPSSLYPQDPEPVSALYSIGSRFTVTSILLALSIYAEQLVVERLGTEYEAALYFTHTTYFLLLISIGNGYLGFLIGPWIRDNHDVFSGLLKSKWILFVPLAAVYALVLNFMGWGAWQVISPSVGTIDPFIQCIFLFNAFIRTLYTIPSGYNGVFGRPRQHDLLILSQIVVVGLILGLFLGLRTCGMNLIHAVALASTANWALRSLSAFLVMGQIHKGLVKKARV